MSRQSSLSLISARLRLCISAYPLGLSSLRRSALQPPVLHLQAQTPVSSSLFRSSSTTPFDSNLMSSTGFVLKGSWPKYSSPLRAPKRGVPTPQCKVTCRVQATGCELLSTSLASFHPSEVQ
ncbi:hypothetical protein HAX54_020699 [Datura stramonium]|uniref:Uncharacterized protein n=1 Tax=Datura stramonium TaxID=4076 RepID=A0ABS8Y566_DATST|nr:hypothetical protein [Datura stramonium]